MPTDELSNTLNRSLDTVLGHENIAIVVLMLVALMEGVLVYYLLKNIFSVREVLQNLHLAIGILNERLTKHHNEHDE